MHHPKTKNMTKKALLIKRVRQFLKREIGHSKQILDIGCGDGATALYLISSLNCTVQGIDMDAGRVHRANEKFKRKPHKGFAVCSVLKAEDMSRKTFQMPFDAVVITHAFHHLDNVRKALARAKNVLARDGKIIIIECTARFGEEIDDCPRFSADKIKRLMANAGFKKIKRSTLTPGLFALMGFK
jgi:cyclopropane fatty-acyl-phospholipid synthase-like methyltransferase